jgi:hypothetical protein
MTNNTSSIVSKVRSFCNPLRDAGIGYGDFEAELTTDKIEETICQSLLSGNIMTKNFDKGI